MPDQWNRDELRYSNYLEIGHNAFEFVLQFGQRQEPEEKAARMHTWIVTSPRYAKHFAELLEQSIRRYEQDHGPIPGEEP